MITGTGIDTIVGANSYTQIANLVVNNSSDIIQTSIYNLSTSVSYNGHQFSTDRWCLELDAYWDCQYHGS